MPVSLLALNESATPALTVLRPHHLSRRPRPTVNHHHYESKERTSATRIKSRSTKFVTVPVFRTAISASLKSAGGESVAALPSEPSTFPNTTFIGGATHSTPSESPVEPTPASWLSVGMSIEAATPEPFTLLNRSLSAIFTPSSSKSGAESVGTLSSSGSVLIEVASWERSTLLDTSGGVTPTASLSESALEDEPTPASTPKETASSTPSDLEGIIYTGGSTAMSITESVTESAAISSASGSTSEQGVPTETSSLESMSSGGTPTIISSSAAAVLKAVTPLGGILIEALPLESFSSQDTTFSTGSTPSSTSEFAIEKESTSTIPESTSEAEPSPVTPTSSSPASLLTPSTPGLSALSIPAPFPPSALNNLRNICSDPTLKTITLPILDRFYGPNAYPALAPYPGCTVPNGRQATQAPGLLNCSALGAEVQRCQKQGVRVLLSVKGDPPLSGGNILGHSQGHKSPGDALIRRTEGRPVTGSPPVSHPAAGRGGRKASVPNVKLPPPDSPLPPGPFQGLPGHGPLEPLWPNTDWDEFRDGTHPNYFDDMHPPTALALTLFSLFGEGHTERADLRPLGPDAPSPMSLDGKVWLTRPLGEEVVLDGFDVQVPGEWKATDQAEAFQRFVQRLRELNDEVWKQSGGKTGGTADLGAAGKGIVLMGWT